LQDDEIDAYSVKAAQRGDCAAMVRILRHDDARMRTLDVADSLERCAL